jgi:hypothetical protein
MKIKLIKPWAIGENAKPVGMEFEVTHELGNQLIEEGIAEDLDPKEEKIINTKKTK